MRTVYEELRIVVIELSIDDVVRMSVGGSAYEGEDGQPEFGGNDIF